MKTKKNHAKAQRRNKSIIQNYLFLLLILFSPSSYAATYTVSNTNDAGAGSFRQAILNANSNAGADVIEFNIAAAGVQTIALTSLLPTITETVTIDGWRQGGIGYTGVPLILINGSGFTPRNDGLYLNASNCIVRGLIIQGFDTGIRIEQSTNSVYGNYIGTNATGTAPAGNGRGVYITSSTNTIGGSSATMRNIISGNTAYGIHLENAGATGNKIQGNYIGTNVGGTAAVANSGQGIYLQNNASSNIIGTNGNGIDDATEGNLISGNNSQGILLVGGSNSNAIAGNLIGTDVNGTAKVSNTSYGIYVNGSNSNQIGGGLVVQRNIISGNRYGIDLDGNSSQNKIQGNYIGTNITGTVALSNTYYGIYTTNITYCIFGTDADGVNDANEGNVISGNGFTAIHLFRNCHYNTVAGNLMGTDKNGTTSIRNTICNIYVNESNNNQIGGGLAVQRNLISCCSGYGIYIENCTLTNKIQGNYIGTDISGTLDLGNSNHGIWMFNTLSNVIVGTDNDGVNDATEGNLISGNDASGIFFESSANSNTVAGNLIGTTKTGTTGLPNAQYGIYVKNCSNNTIGGTGTYSANKIAFNTLKGLSIESGTGNTLRRNSIHSNGGMAVDLGNNGITGNDANDPDIGPNNLQNFPVINTHTWTSTSVRLIGTLNSESSKTYTIEFFYSPTLGPASSGEAMNYLGSTTVSTNASGNANFDITFPVAVPVGYYITSTATDPSNNTSELSALPVALPVTLVKFEASLQGNNTVLRWDIADEKDLLGYSVESSSDGQSFDSIGFVASKKAIYSYQFTDRYVFSGTYYRLKMIDQDGSFVYSPLRFVSPIANGVTVSVFPNPARESFTLAISDMQSSIHLIMSDLIGKSVYENLLETELNDSLAAFKVNTKNLKPGTYIMTLTSQTGEKTYQKVYIEN